MLDVNEKALQRTAPRYGIINISVASLRRQPVYQAEILDQTVLGTIVPIYEEQNDFYYVENWDGYVGWINKASVKPVDRGEAESWHRAPKLLISALYDRVMEKADEFSECLSDLVPFAMLRQLDTDSAYYKVELPDGRTGFVKCASVANEDFGEARAASPEIVSRLARKFLGVPYLWGGTSAKAFDCSGFVQTVFRFLDFGLPRNASQMAALGTGVEIDARFSHLRAGDLLFFGKSARRITHVALSLGGSFFIHSEGFVRINSLDPAHKLYAEHRSKTFLHARRILLAEKGGTE